MVEQLVFMLIYVFVSLVAYMYFAGNYELKIKPVFSLLISIGLYLIGFVINLAAGNNLALNSIYSFVVPIAFSLLSFNIGVKSAIFHSSILFAIMVSSELATESIVSVALNVPLDAYKNNVDILIFVGVICKLLYLLLSKLISLLFSLKIKKNTKSIKTDVILFLYPVLTTTMLEIFMYSSYNYAFSSKLNSIGIIVSVVSLFLCGFIFVYNMEINKRESELLDLRIQKQVNDVNKTFYDMLEKKNEEQRVFVHDMKHHFTALNSCDDMDSVREYISNIQPVIDEYRYIGTTDNNMLDLILSKYSHICNKHGIDFKTDIHTSNLSFIADSDLVSLMGNLLDNAVESAVNSTAKYIALSIRTENKFELINLENSCDKKPEQSGGVLVSIKKDSGLHGYGVKSIRKTAKKYNGICDWHYSENEKAFHFNILFNR